MSSHPDVPYVNEKDEVIGIGQLSNARQSGYAVRIARLFLVNHDGLLLLQQRAANVNDPNTWDCSADGYVDALDNGEVEDYGSAVIREAYEELGIKLTVDELQEVAHYLFIDGTNKDWTKAFIAYYDTTKHGDLKPSPEEIQATEWASLRGALEDVNTLVREFEPGFPLALRNVIDRIGLNPK